MSEDLLEAAASVDWAIDQIKVLQERIAKWQRGKPYTTVTEPDSQSGQEIIKLKLREPLPIVISVEAGAIIHMIRSSLDILAVALAARNGYPRSKKVYFPIAKSAADFIRPNDGAIQKIRRLSDADRLRIEQFKPYDGGDNILFSLHQLDIMRKHQRLIGVTPRHRAIGIYRWGNFPPRSFFMLAHWTTTSRYFASRLAPKHT